MKEIEGKLQDKIVEFLKKAHIWFFRYPSSNTYGIPDLIIIYKGYFVGVEVKREDGKGKPSGLQEKIIESIIEAGGFGRVVSSMNEFLSLLDDIDNYET